MLVLLVGELLNFVKYFLIFVNVNKDNCKDFDGIFGIGNNNIWQLWEYKVRLKVVKEVE